MIEDNDILELEKEDGEIPETLDDIDDSFLDEEELEESSEYVENLEDYRFSANATTITLYLATIKNLPRIDRMEEQELARKVKEGDETAREKLIEGNLRLVVYIAKSYRPNTTLAFIDLIQEGNIGLMKAVDKYDPERGIRFGTYATYWIRQAISQAVNDYSRTIRLPNNAINMISHINKKYKELEKKNGETPSVEQVAAELDITPEQILHLQKIQVAPTSIDMDVNDDGDTELLDLITDTKMVTPEQYSEDVTRRESLLKLLDTLDDREKYIITHRYGLIDDDPKTLEQIGEEIGLTKERSRQIEIKALRKLRSPWRQKALKEMIG